MAIISAAEAFQRTMTKDKRVAATITEWIEKFNSQVEKAAEGDEGHSGETSIFYHISAATEMLVYARDSFVAKLRLAGYKVSMYDSNDDNDHFVYRVDWSEPIR